MIVGVDAKRIVRNGTGLGSYGRTLVNDLLRCGDSTLDLRLYAPDEGNEELRGQMIEGAQFCYPAGKSGAIRKAWWRTKGIVKDLKRDGVSVYHGLSGELPIGLRKAGIHGVVTIHDLIFLRHPEYYNWIDTKIYEWKFRQTLCEAERIIAISERTKQDIIELGGAEYADRISVIYQSFAPRFSTVVTAERKAKVRERYRLPARYVLNVGTIERRKNLLLATEALDLLPKDIHLVAVGKQTPYVQELPKDERIHLLSGVPDEDLLPVVACTGSCLEEAGGPNCRYVGPDDVTGMAEALKMSLRGARDREERIAKSREYIKRFEGRDVAGQVAEVYRAVAGEPRHTL